jgi:hypothetical protein
LKSRRGKGKNEQEENKIRLRNNEGEKGRKEIRGPKNRRWGRQKRRE